MNKKQKADLAEFKICLARTSSADFDGHTDFNRMTPEERLLWLSQCGDFLSVVNNSNGGPES